MTKFEQLSGSGWVLTDPKYDTSMPVIIFMKRADAVRQEQVEESTTAKVLVKIKRESTQSAVHRSLLKRFWRVVTKEGLVSR